MSNIKLGIVVPCFNESEIILDTIETISTLLTNLKTNNTIDNESFVLFVDDGSQDNTFELIKSKKDNHIKIIRLSRNTGHQYALLAGLQFVKDNIDCLISIDADLQDDLSVIELMIGEFKKGADIVCGVRDNRDTDSFFKKISAKGFYFLMNIFGVKLIENHADFRLLSKFAIYELLRYNEKNIFFRGLLLLVNSNVTTVHYIQKKRMKGKSKYNLKKMISLALQGITSFTTAPIRMITILGLIISFICLVFSLNVLFTYFTEKTVPGWASITLPLYFLGGVQLFSIGIIGEYIGKIYMETKNRPHYHIKDIID